MELLFGGMPDAARFVVAFLLVLGLIGAGAFLWRKFGSGTLSTTGPRGRQPRLAVIDAAAVDGRRRLVLIRRDNTEHLLMIGGPTDIVVEPNINRTGANSVAREARPIPVGEIPPRQPGPAEGPAWAAQPVEPATRPIRSMEDLDAARAEPAPRSAREAMAESMRAMRAEPAPRTGAAAPLRPEPADEITAPALTPPPPPPEPNFHTPAVPEPRRAAIQPVPPPPPYEPVFQTSPEPKRMPMPPSHEPIFQAIPPEPPWPPPPPAHEPVFQSGAATEPKRATPRPSQAEENNLAEMAQRLEAALRRPTKPVEPPAPPPVARPAARPEPPAVPVSRAAAYFESLNAPKGTVKAPDPPPPPTPELKVLPGQGKSEPQAPFASLEDEMAKMLGRSPGKT